MPPFKKDKRGGGKRQGAGRNLVKGVGYCANAMDRDDRLEYVRKAVANHRHQVTPPQARGVKKIKKQVVLNIQTIMYMSFYLF